MLNNCKDKGRKGLHISKQRGKNHIPHMTHWEKDAALSFAGAVENDHGGRL
jgi:hypothetical protein